MFVIVKDGVFVAQPGAERSYTPNLFKARFFETREAAQADACGNERVVSVEGILGRG